MHFLLHPSETYYIMMESTFMHVLLEVDKWEISAGVPLFPLNNHKKFSIHSHDTRGQMEWLKFG